MPIPARRRLRLAAAAAALAVVAGCGGSGGPPPPGPDVGTRLDAKMPASILQLPLTTSTGKHTSLSAYAGKVMVVSDSLTLCQESCPLDTSNVVEAARAVQHAGLGDKVVFLTITVDPQRDTPHRLAAYRKFYANPGQLPDWRLLTGSKHAIATLWRHLGVFTKKVPLKPKDAGVDWLTHKRLTYDVAHSDIVFFFDARQHERFLIDGIANARNGAVPSTLRAFLSDTGKKNLHHPRAGSWTVGQALQTVSWLAGRKISR